MANEKIFEVKFNGNEYGFSSDRVGTFTNEKVYKAKYTNTKHVYSVLNDNGAWMNYGSTRFYGMWVNEDTLPKTFELTEEDFIVNRDLLNKIIDLSPEHKDSFEKLLNVLWAVEHSDNDIILRMGE